MAELPALADTRLVLICNAVHAASEPPRFHDHDDVGETALGPEGRGQAERLLARLLATGELAETSALLTSNARRAIETAEIIGPSLGTGITESSCGFCEPHSGECDGMAVDEWMATLAQNRIDNWSPYAPKSPGGEALRVAMDRTARALIDAVLAYAGGTVVVVTHTVPLRSSLWAFLGLPFHAQYAYPEFTHTGITEWVADGWMPGTGQLKARLVRYNDHAHLMPGAWA